MAVTKPVRTPILTDKQKKELRAKDEKSSQVSLFGEIKEEMTVSKVLLKKLIYMGDEERQKEKKEIELIKETIKRYNFNCTAYVQRGTIMEAAVCDRCCENLNKAMELENYDVKGVKLLKDIIRTNSFIDCPFNLIYIYTNVQSDFIRLLGEIRGMNFHYNIHDTIDRAYKEVFNEMPAKKLVYKR